MISVVIPTLNAEETLGATLQSLAPAGTLVREVIVSDGGSTDRTAGVAKSAGAQVLVGQKGRGAQLKLGAARAREPWLLFLHADTVLDPSWAEEARRLYPDDKTAGVFRLAFNSEKIAAHIVAAGANLRTLLFASSYGDQGLLISRALYDEVGGYGDMPLFEDVDIVDRILKHGGRCALRRLEARAVTSPARYEKSGYVRQVLRNWSALARYRLGASPTDIVKAYEKT
jgi:rSAM/selenodomain-associated transferase 2